MMVGRTFLVLAGAFQFGHGVGGFATNFIHCCDARFQSGILVGFVPRGGGMAIGYFFVDGRGLISRVSAIFFCVSPVFFCCVCLLCFWGFFFLFFFSPKTIWFFFSGGGMRKTGNSRSARFLRRTNYSTGPRSFT